MTREEFEAKLQEFVGKPIGAPTVGRDLVNEPMIRQWCDAMGDQNPIYWDPNFAKQSVHGSLVAPPTMLQGWTLDGIKMAFPDDSKGDLQKQLHCFFNDNGYDSVLGTNCDQEYDRYLKPGDQVKATTVIEAISEQKATAVGTGYFITTKTTFTDQNDQRIGTMTFRVLKYKAANKPKPVSEGATAQSAAPKRIRPVLGHDNKWWWDGVSKKELRIQKCSGCKTLRHPPRPMCPHCQSLKWESIQASGKATVHSFVTIHYPVIPPFDYPLIVGVMDLEEGTRFVSNILCDPKEVYVGMKVELVFEQVEEDMILPLFRPVKG